MKYDFTSVLDRRGKDAIAIDALGHGTAPGAPKEGFDPIPMWVADMDFACAPCIVEAVQKRAAHPVYGYGVRQQPYYDAVMGWLKKRHGFEVNYEHLAFAPPGVIYAMKLPIFNQKHRYFGSHEIFHLFVMGGSLCHFILIYQYLAVMA